MTTVRPFCSPATHRVSPFQNIPLSFFLSLLCLDTGHSISLALYIFFKIYATAIRHKNDQFPFLSLWSSSTARAQAASLLRFLIDTHTQNTHAHTAHIHLHTHTHTQQDSEREISPSHRLLPRQHTTKTTDGHIHALCGARTRDPSNPLSSYRCAGELLTAADRLQIVL